VPPIQKSLVASALKFTFHSPFINPSLASPDLVSVEKDHLVWSDSRMKAVFFTTGCVSGCNVITPAPGINNSAAAKKLLLFPIEGIFQEALSFFGFKFKVDLVAGQINNGVVTYSTKQSIRPPVVSPFTFIKSANSSSDRSDPLSSLCQMERAVRRKKVFSRNPLPSLLHHLVGLSP